MNIYDIAEKAGVSIATVSRVINANGPVSARTAEKVLKVVNELGYRPNVFAKGLNTNSMRVIGVLTTNIRDLYFASAIHTIEACARKNGYDILLSCATSGVEDKKKHIGLLLEKRVDAIILIGSVFKEPGGNAHILEAAKAAPVVLLNGSVEGCGVYSVICDDAAGTRAATEYLLTRGRLDVAYVYDADTFAGRSKLAGYRSAMESAGLRPIVRAAPAGLDGGFEAAGALLREIPGLGGVVCSEDELAAGAMKRLRLDGKAVPGDMAVIGYNDSLLARCTVPELASVDGKVTDLSACALETALKAIGAGDAPQKTVVTPELVVRGSADI